MEDVGMIEKHGIASYSKMKAYASQSEYDGVCSGIYDERAFWDKKQDWFAIIDNAKQTFSGMTETYSQSVECGKLLSYLEKWNTKVSSRDLFSEAVQKFRDDNQLSAQELKEEKDWREMTDEEWDKMLEGVDEYIDAFKERLRQLKEIQDAALTNINTTTQPTLQQYLVNNKGEIDFPVNSFSFESNRLAIPHS